MILSKNTSLNLASYPFGWYLKILLAWESHSADCLMSHNLSIPLLLLYTKRLHSFGWNSAAVITSVSSSIFAGLISTISFNIRKYWFKTFYFKIKLANNLLKLWLVISLCHRLIRKSSADMNVSWSLFNDIELIW